MDRPIAGVMTFATDPTESAQWLAPLLGKTDDDIEIDRNGDSRFACFDLHGVEVGFHQADDDRNPRGASPVIYWAVDNLDAARERLLSAGAVPHRGPLPVTATRRICRIIAPDGTVHGLDGP